MQNKGAKNKKELPAPQIILGIDPGYDRCGIAVIQKTPGAKRDTLLFSHCVQTAGTSAFEDRLCEVIEHILEAIERFKPHTLALETLFFSANRKTALRVAETRGAIIYAAVASGLTLCEYSPASVKIAVTGYGGSDKGAIIEMIPRLIDFEKSAAEKKALRDDEYDAIAVAITHSAHTTLR